MKHKQVRFARLVAISLILIILGFAGCDFQEPVLPSWTVPVQVPLSQQTFRLGDYLLNDSTIVAQGSDSLIYFSLDGSLDTLRIDGDLLTLPSLDTTQAFSLGTIRLDSMAALSPGLKNLRQLMPELENLVGQPIPFTVPETTLAPAPEWISSSDFKKILLESGELTIQFTNNLPFPVGPNTEHPEGIRFAVFDSSGTLITEFFVDQVVDSGQQVQRSSPLVAGLWIYNPIRIEYQLPVAQSTSFLITDQLLDHAGFELNLYLKNVRAAEAVARVEAQQVSRTMSLAVPGENRLQYARLEEGGILLDIANSFPVQIQLQLAFPFITTNEKQPVVEQVVIPARGQQSIWVNLNQTEIGNSQAAGTYLDSIQVAYQVRSQRSQQFVHIRHSDSISVQVHMDSLHFSSFAGLLAGDTLKLPSIVQNDIADYQGFDPDVQFDQVNLEVELHNEVNVENLALNLSLVGYHEENGQVTDSARLALTQQLIQPGTPDQPGNTVIQFSGQDLAQFLSILPTSLCVQGQAYASGYTEIIRDSRLWGEYRFSTPLRIQLQNVAPWEGEPVTIPEEDMDTRLRDAAADEVSEAALSLSVENHTPLGGVLRLVVSADPAAENLYQFDQLNPDLTFVKEVSLAAAPVDPVSGFVLQSSEQPLQLTLSAEEAALFSKTPLKVGYWIKIDDTQGAVAIRASDYLRVQGVIQVMLKAGNSHP